jgi:hypothetical protein
MDPYEVRTVVDRAVEQAVEPIAAGLHDVARAIYPLGAIPGEDASGEPVRLRPSLESPHDLFP